MDTRCPKQHQSAKVVVQMATKPEKSIRYEDYNDRYRFCKTSISDSQCGYTKVLLRKQLRRSGMTKFFANLEPYLIGMETWSSSP